MKLSSLVQMLSLKKLYLRSNSFDQRINILISELRRLKNLQELYLDGSYNDERFLHEVGDVTSLNVLAIRGCGLNGSLTVVKGWCELIDLRELDLSYNNFEGMMPSCLANLTKLRIFDISFNRFNESFDLLPLLI